MKKFFATSLLVLSLAFFVQAAHVRAAIGDQCQDQAGKYLTDANGNALIQQNDGTCAADVPVGGTTDPAAAKTPANVQNTPQFDGIFATVMVSIMSLFAWLLGVAMITLNWAVYFTVIKMGDYIHNLTAIGVTWRILRDIANIMFIFGFLGAGISMIVGNTSYGFKKALPMLLVGAIFLNFSLFITEAMIDGTNLFAVQFYKQINGGQLPTVDTLTNEGISGKLMDQLGLASIYSDTRKDPNLLTAKTSVFVAFMSILLFLVTAFVLFSLAFILIARFVALIFFILLSPVAFMGLALPGMKHRADEWWSNFLKQIVTAPVLMLLLYVALAVITDANFLAFGGTPSWSGVFSTTSGSMDMTGFAGMLLSYLIAMGLLFVVVIKAKSMSAFGAGQATTLAGKATFGLTGWGVNRTVGRAAYYSKRRLQQSAGFNKFDALTGRAITRSLNSAATGSYDVRGAALGGGLKKLGFDPGEAAKDGFAGARKRTIEDHEKAAKDIETAHKDGFNEKDRQMAIAAAKAKLESDQKSAQATYDPLATAVASQKVILDQLEKDEKDRVYNAIQSTPQQLAELEAARSKFKTSNTELAKAAKNLDDATKSIAALETEQGKDKAAADALKKKIVAGKTAYAEGLDHPIWNVLPISPNLYAYGPGSGEAANKIKASLKAKSDTEQLAEIAKRLAAQDATTSSGSKAAGATAGTPPAATGH